MPNYQQQTKTGEVVTYLAAKGGRFENPYGEPPVLSFDEVERTVVDGVLVAERPTGRALRVAVQEPGVTIPYINPETYAQILDEAGQPLPGQSFTDEQFAYLVACAYIYAAKAADELAQHPLPRPPRARRQLEEDPPA